MNTTLLSILLFFNLVLFGQDKNQYENFTSSTQTLILNYDDFGPQVLAYEFIGFQWWQWHNHGDSDPKKTYDIRVIVFKDISLEAVKAKYPINEKRKVDFRYTSYDESLKYLDKAIDEIRGDFNIDSYSELRVKIISHFKPK